MRQRILEVERKFCSNGATAFFANIGNPPIKGLRYTGSTKFTDTYYDQGVSLRTAGIYIRQREARWEAKVRKGGNFINSTFEETTSLSQIAGYAQTIGNVQGRADVGNHFGLHVVAKLATTRLAWTADHGFKIVLDSTDFGHEVGEVELEHVIEPSNQRDDHEAVRSAMNERIERFMAMHKWAFPPGVPKGKLSAYFDIHKSQPPLKTTEQ